MSKNGKLSVDFGKTIGKMKPMHGIGQPPLTGLSNSLFHYLTRAGIPYSRLHDVGGWHGGDLYVDIPNLFRNFAADENDPASYDFAYTDKIIEGLVKAGCEPYFRLGVTIENAHMVKAYRIFPPQDYEKWARICEHIVRHYNEGWADGYFFNITYWEIWNEPDDCYKEETAAMWKGTPEQYYRLYSVTAKHLKACFGDAIKIGGYGHCGLYEYEKDKDFTGIEDERYIYDFVINFMHGFFKYQKKTSAPIDFFSWHVYDNCHSSVREDFKLIKEHADYIRKVLDHYGFNNAEHHLNEWNLWTKRRRRDEAEGATKNLSFMLMMQNTSVDVMCFYDGGLGFSDYRSLINPDTGYPYSTYYAFLMFNALYTLENQVYTEIDEDEIFACATRCGRKAEVVLTNNGNEDAFVELDITNFMPDDVEILRIDEENRYTLTGENIKNGRIFIPAKSAVEIKFWEK